MSKSNDSTEMSTVIEVEPIALELKPVKPAFDADEAIETRSISADDRSTDETDQGCTKCGSVETVKSKERVSLSGSSDDETDQTISLAMNNKKSNNIAYKGLMDIALITANANQLRFLIMYNSEEKTFYISATLIILSLFVQVFVGIGMIYRRQIKKKGNGRKADKVGVFVISGIFCLAVLNVLVVSFTTTSTIKSPN